MAFCNSCGASLPAGAAFCEKCGSAVSPGNVAATSTTPAPLTTPSGAVPQKSGALKTILIVGGVLVALVILGIATTIIVGVKIASRTHVRQEGDKVKVETPFGTVESNQDPEEIAKNLGVDVYPGARPLRNNSAAVAIGGMRTVTAQFETDDSVSKVADFYKKKLPNANVSEGRSDHYTLVQSDSNGALTITIAPAGSSTHINIANVRKGVSSTQ